MIGINRKGMQPSKSTTISGNDSLGATASGSTDNAISPESDSITSKVIVVEGEGEFTGTISEEDGLLNPDGK